MNQPSFPKALQELWLKRPGDASRSTDPPSAFHRPSDRHQSCFLTARKQQEEIMGLERDIAILRAQATQPVPSQADLVKELTERMNQLGRQLGQQLKECPGQVQELRDRITPLDWVIPPEILQAGGNVDGSNHSGRLPEA